MLLKYYRNNMIQAQKLTNFVKKLGNFKTSEINIINFI